MSRSAQRPIDAVAYAEAERRLGTLLDTNRDVLLLQGEAILALEAVARGLGGPGVRALNLVSGPYGQAIGDWLEVGGATVEHLTVGFDQAIDPAAVAAAITREHYDIVSVVHAESATGAVNPLAEISGIAHAAGAIVVVDAVASVGAEPLPIDDLDLDLTMIGPQKALGGPAGVCAVIAGERSWESIAANPAAPRDSILSLLDWKQRWIDAGRKQIPGYAYEHEMRALLAALDVLEGDVGLARLVERHQRAAEGARAGARALGLEPWITSDSQATAVVTLLRPPAGVSTAELAAAAREHLDEADQGLLAPAPGPLAQQALRVNHTGEAARPAAVRSAIAALADGLRTLGLNVSPGAALAAAEAALF